MGAQNQRSKGQPWRPAGAFVVTLCLLTGIQTATVATAQQTKSAAPAKRTLVLGKVSINPKKHYEHLKPMADYVVKHMADLGIDESRVLMAKDNRQLAEYMRQGKVDWVTETLFAAVMLQEEAGAEPLLLKWKKGVPDYQSIFIARKESNIKSLADLRGKTIAFEHPGSTSAFFLPAMALVKGGLRLVELASPRDKPSADTVGYVFARQEINISTWVHKGLVDAGAYNDLDFEKEDRTPKAFRKDFNIFHRTESFPRAIEVVNKDLDPRIKQRLKEVLLNADKNPRGEAALRAYQETEKFEELGTRTLAQLAEARRILKVVRSKLE